MGATKKNKILKEFLQKVSEELITIVDENLIIYSKLLTAIDNYKTVLRTTPKKNIAAVHVENQLIECISRVAEHQSIQHKQLVDLAIKTMKKLTQAKNLEKSSIVPQRQEPDELQRIDPIAARMSELRTIMEIQKVPTRRDANGPGSG